MRSFLVLALLIVAAAVVQGAVDIEKAIKLLNKCKKETGATENVEEMIKTKTIPTTPEGKCMILCAAREKGFVKDERINTKAISDFMEVEYANEPEKLEKAAETLQNVVPLTHLVLKNVTRPLPM
ncbi:general odorant-binding protein 19d-like [Homalodisca vitripennis]|uniref:general odorant-binding protein 19d-like n=1 Tax=Homalodisca vitripennis TaxID=197043 RepID=UPI001EEA937E|nr:general odorant-binding protein 19d-like [Homalodisca vitripennis]